MYIQQKKKLQKKEHLCVQLVNLNMGMTSSHPHVRKDKSKIVEKLESMFSQIQEIDPKNIKESIFLILEKNGLERQVTERTLFNNCFFLENSLRKAIQGDEKQKKILLLLLKDTFNFQNELKVIEAEKKERTLGYGKEY